MRKLTWSENMYDYDGFKRISIIQKERGSKNKNTVGFKPSFFP